MGDRHLWQRQLTLLQSTPAKASGVVLGQDPRQKPFLDFRKRRCAAGTPQRLPASTLSRASSLVFPSSCAAIASLALRSVLALGASPAASLRFGEGRGRAVPLLGRSLLVEMVLATGDAPPPGKALEIIMLTMTWTRTDQARVSRTARQSGIPSRTNRVG